jgi:propionyl-CoA synthetase
MASLADVHRRSLERPEAFWAQAAAEIDWTRPWQRVLDDSGAPFYRWFAGGRLNTCHNALDRHVERGRADQLALIYDSPVTGASRRFTYRELRDAVARFAGVLAAEGVERGDRVVIYMPMVPEAAIAMLACARLGAIHSAAHPDVAECAVIGVADQLKGQLPVGLLVLKAGPSSRAPRRAATCRGCWRHRRRGRGSAHPRPVAAPRRGG